jgi:hypothetical protein
MRLETVLNRQYPHKGFVIEDSGFHCGANNIAAFVRGRAGSLVSCSVCGRLYDRLGRMCAMVYPGIVANVAHGFPFRYTETEMAHALSNHITPVFATRIGKAILRVTKGGSFP